MQREWWRKRRRGRRRRSWRRRGKKTDLQWLTVLLAAVEVAGRSYWRRWRCQRWRFSPFLPCFFFSSSFFFLSRFSPLYPYSAPLFFLSIPLYCFFFFFPVFLLFFLCFFFSFSLSVFCSLLYFFLFFPVLYPPFFFSTLSSPIFIGKTGEREPGATTMQPAQKQPEGHIPSFFHRPLIGHRSEVIQVGLWSVFFMLFGERGREKLVKKSHSSPASHVQRKKKTYSAVQNDTIWVFFLREQCMKRRCFGQNAPFHLKGKGGKKVSEFTLVLNLWFVQSSPQLHFWL